MQRKARLLRLAAGLAMAWGVAGLVSPSWAGPTQVPRSPANAGVRSPAPVTMTFPLSRTGDAAYDAWARYQTRNGTAVAGSDYTPASGEVEVPAGATGAGIPVQILGASGYSPDKQFTLNLLGATGVGPLPSFASQRTLTPGTLPSSVTVTDIDGDGKSDLVVANSYDGTVSVLLKTTAPGAATASFAAQQSFAVRNAPQSVAIGDLNGDGKPDIAVANWTSNSVSSGTSVTGTLGASDPDGGQSLTYSIVSQPGHGTVTLANAATGAFTYTPASGYAGGDSFSFKANDGYEDSNVATESVTVNAVSTGTGGSGGGGGGGGADSPLALLAPAGLVCLAGLRRRAP